MSYPARTALRVGGIYLVLAALWILFSDRVVDAMFADPDVRSVAQTVKGIVFIVASAGLIGGLIYRDASLRYEAETRYRSMVDQSLVGIYVVRGDRVLSANARLSEILGYTVKELTSSVPLHQVLAPEERERVSERIRRREEGEEEDGRYTLTAVRKDGRRLRLEVHGRRILWEGEPAVLGVLVDVTERERLEARERRKQRLETLGQLTAAVTHDFKNLLTSITTPVELALDRLEPQHPARSDLVDARDNTKRAVVLTRQLLAFCRQRPYQARSVDLETLTEKTEPMLRRLLPEGVDLRLDVEPDLPAAWVDPDRLEQVLLNLTMNGMEAVDEEGTIRIVARSAKPQETLWNAEEGAVPATEAREAALNTGFGEGRVAGAVLERATGTGGPGFVVLEVADDGRGMDEETRRQVFEPFFSTKRNGTGLGLATVHGIVSQAEGHIDVDSTPGEGTAFTIQLPASGAPPQPLEGEAEPEPAHEPESEPGTVLVVDDDMGVRRTVSRALERHGYQVLQAETAQAAMHELAAEGASVDLILTDVALPDQDGVGLAAHVSGEHPGVKVLLMSGRTKSEVMDAHGGSRAGFLEKPFSVNTLIRAVKRSLG